MELRDIILASHQAEVGNFQAVSIKWNEPPTEREKDMDFEMKSALKTSRPYSKSPPPPQSNKEVNGRM